MRGRSFSVLGRALSLALAIAVGGPDGRAEEVAGPAGPRRFGLGWHAGNGLGLLGANLIAVPAPRVALELQLASVREDAGVAGTVSGYGVALAARGYLLADGSSPYALVGTSVARRRLGPESSTRTGLLANVGYAWRLDSGLGLLAGGGVEVTRDGSDRVISPRAPGLRPNLELGVRYMFR